METSNIKKNIFYYSFEGMFHNNMANGYGKFVSPKKEVSG